MEIWLCISDIIVSLCIHINMDVLMLTLNTLMFTPYRYVVVGPYFPDGVLEFRKQAVVFISILYFIDVNHSYPPRERSPPMTIVTTAVPT